MVCAGQRLGMGIVAHRALPGHLFVGKLDPLGSVAATGLLHHGESIVKINSVDASTITHGEQPIYSYID